jgi:hypothetical protein
MEVARHKMPGVLAGKNCPGGYGVIVVGSLVDRTRSNQADMQSIIPFPTDGPCVGRGYRHSMPGYLHLVPTTGQYTLPPPRTECELRNSGLIDLS